MMKMNPQIPKIMNTQGKPKYRDASPWIQSLTIKVIMRLEPKNEILKYDKYFPPNISSKDLEPPKRNFKEKSLNHHSRLEIKINRFLK